MTARVDLRGAVLAEVATLAATHAGIEPRMLDRRLVRQAMEARMVAHRLVEPEDYLAFCRVTPSERLALIEATANGETSFFRDRNVFAELTSWCVSRLAGDATLRILSAPCSTGEEPYSIAAALLRAGVSAERFAIEALDLSHRAIEHARRGVYGKMSLRGVSEMERDEFLEHTPHGWCVKDAVRGCVRFRQANIVEPGALGDATYDLVFSRNMLLYQSTEARQRVAAALASVLAADGRLVLGSADWGGDLEPWFALEQPVRSLAAGHRHQEPTIAPVTPNSAPKKPVARPGPAGPAASMPRAVPVTHSMEEELARTAELYRQALEARIQKQDVAAERMCRQALYLDPEHLPSLELLAELHRPHVTGRVRAALTARLDRKRSPVPRGSRQ